MYDYEIIFILYDQICQVLFEEQNTNLFPNTKLQSQSDHLHKGGQTN